MKKWRVFFKSAPNEGSRSMFLEKREETVSLLREIVSSGGFIKDVKYLNKNISAQHFIYLLLESGLEIRIADSN